MRNLAFIIAILSMPLLGLAQNSNDIFKKFKGKEDVTTVSISKYMFSLFSDVETDDADSQEFLELVQTLDGMKILTTENVSISHEVIESVQKHMDKSGFKELMTVEENGKDVVFKIKEEGKKVSELTKIDGIGDAIAKQLEEVGIKTAKDMASADPEKLSLKLNKISKKRIEGWQASI